MQPLKKFSLEIIRAIARNPNIDLQSIEIYSESDFQHQPVHNNIKNHLKKWTQYKIKTYEKLQKLQDFQTSTYKTTADTLKT